MCSFNAPSIPEPQIVSEPVAEMAAAMPAKAKMADQAGSMQRNKMRAAASTVLTSNSGVMAQADTAKKTLLGA